MRLERWWRDGGFHRFFQGVAPDVVALLLAQGRVSLAATEAFLSWSEGGDVDAAALTALEHDADEARRVLLGALRRALATPIDQEDLYILSERCDRVVNAVRDIVAEAEALAWTPDRHAALMADRLHAGMAALVDGFAKLRHESDLVGAAADSARSKARAVVGLYRDALSDLFTSADIQAAVTGRELYRDYARAAELLTAAADRLWYVVLADA